MSEIAPSLVTAPPTNMLQRGIRDALPVAISFAISFFALGALACASGLTLPETVAMSALVFACPAQFAMVDALHSEASLGLICLSVLAINFRFFVMGINLVGRFRNVPLRHLLPALPMLSASTFAVTRLRDGDDGSNFRYYLGVCLGSYPIAVTMSGVGHAISTAFGGTFLRTAGVVLPLYFGILLAKDWRRGAGVAAALGGLLLTPALRIHLPPTLANIAAIPLGASLGLLVISQTLQEPVR